MVSNFFGVVALVSLVRYVIAVEETQPGSSGGGQTCTPSRDLQSISYSTFRAALGEATQETPPGGNFQGLKATLEAWGADEENTQKKKAFLNALDMMYEQNQADYTTLRGSVIAANKGATQIAASCGSQATS